MADDIVTRLREFCQCDEGEFCTHCEAAHLLDAIDALHQRPEPPMPQDQWPADAWFVPWCSTCSVLWPCPTARLLHPEEADRG